MCSFQSSGWLLRMTRSGVILVLHAITLACIVLDTAQPITNLSFWTARSLLALANSRRAPSVADAPTNEAHDRCLQSQLAYAMSSSCDVLKHNVEVCQGCGVSLARLAFQPSPLPHTLYTFDVAVTIIMVTIKNGYTELFEQIMPSRSLLWHRFKRYHHLVRYDFPGIASLRRL